MLQKAEKGLRRVAARERLLLKSCGGCQWLEKQSQQPLLLCGRKSTPGWWRGPAGERVAGMAEPETVAIEMGRVKVAKWDEKGTVTMKGLKKK